MVFGVPFRWTVVVFAASGLLLFVRPFQTAVLTPILGARPAQPEEAALIAPAWAEIAQANNLPPNRYALRVLPSDELNAFACGGHLVVVTSFAAHELTPAQLRGVLAHELSHHLGLHTVAITIAHWLSGARRVPGSRSASSSRTCRRRLRRASGAIHRSLKLSGSSRPPSLRQCRGSSPQRCVRVMHSGTSLAGAPSSKPTNALSQWDSAPSWRVHCARSSPTARAVAPLAGGHGSTASHPAARTRVARIEALQRHPAR